MFETLESGLESVESGHAPALSFTATTGDDSPPPLLESSSIVIIAASPALALALAVVCWRESHRRHLFLQ